MLSLVDLSLGYGGRVVVADACIALDHGETGSLVGPSGCGKSTLLRGIAGLERPMAGSVSMGDRVLSTPEAVVEPRHRRIGMVFQDFALFPHLDVARNIAYGLGEATKAERRAAHSKRRSTGLRPAIRLAEPSETAAGGKQDRGRLGPSR